MNNKTIDAVLKAKKLRIEYCIARTAQKIVAVRGVDLHVSAGTFNVIVGPSGCGKSSLLKAIAGLVPYAAGELDVKGRRVNGPGSDRAFVFQSPALMPWRNVWGNVAYGLELRKAERGVINQRCRAMIELVGLENFADRYPHELSGGMQQRVNLARALAVDPEIILLDEPFSALDAQTRETMQYELLRIWSESSKTALFITHDIREAVLLADQVIVLSHGPESTVLERVNVTLERPRLAETTRSKGFLDMVDHISALIQRREAV